MIQLEAADDVSANEFYRAMVGHLSEAGVRFLVGGAYALEHYTGIARRTKDIDLFVHPRECDAVLAVLAAGGCATEVTSPVWLAKAFCGDDYVDVIFSSGNGIAEVHDIWFAHAVAAEILGVPVQLCAPEGRTSTNVPVYNVCMPLLRERWPDRPPFRVIELPVPVAEARP